MNKRLFAPRFSPRGAETTKHNVDGIGDLRQRVTQLRINGDLNTPGISPNGRRVGAAMALTFGSLINIRSR